MTRGQIAAILPDGKLITSVEFNGDMYYSGGHGEEVFSELECIESEKEYREFVKDFNDRNFRYTDRELFYDCDESFSICQRITSANGFPITSMLKTFRKKKSCLSTPVNKNSTRTGRGNGFLFWQFLREQC